MTVASLNYHSFVVLIIINFYLTGHIFLSDSERVLSELSALDLVKDGLSFLSV